MIDDFYLIGSALIETNWRGKEQLGEEVINEHGDDVNDDLAFGDGPRHGPFSSILLRKGSLAPIQFQYVFRLLSLTQEIDGVRENHEVQLIRNVVREVDHQFLLFRPIQSLDVVDFSKSMIEEWPPGTKLDPWHDPRGSEFFQPAIKWDELPKGIKAFRLADWPGASNIVVSDAYKRMFESGMESGYLSFTRLAL